MKEKYNTLEYYNAQERAYKIGKYLIVGIGIICFLILFILCFNKDRYNILLIAENISLLRTKVIIIQIGEKAPSIGINATMYPTVKIVTISKIINKKAING